MIKLLKEKKLYNIILRKPYGFVFFLIFVFLFSSILTFGVYFIDAQNITATVQPGTLVFANSCALELPAPARAECIAHAGCINHIYDYSIYDPNQAPALNADYSYDTKIYVEGFTCAESPVRNSVRINGDFSLNVMAGEGEANVLLTGRPRFIIYNSNGCSANSYTETKFNYSAEWACPHTVAGGGGNECDPFCYTGQLGVQKEGPTGITRDNLYSGACCQSSPVLIDINGDGFAMTDTDRGVDFDFNGDGIPHRMSWTTANSDDAWLVLDRNGNGIVDSSREMFGNFTEQPASTERNGFLALAEFDKAKNDGNSDGVIDSHDAIFTSL